MTPIHIRTTDHASTLCGSEGGSISLRHYQEQPQHVRGLPICAACQRESYWYTTGPWVPIPDTLGRWASQPENRPTAANEEE